MINGITWLVVMQLLGEIVVRATGLPVPGAVVGMLLLLMALVVRRPNADASIFRVGDGLLRHLQLFFVPAGVGVMVHLALLRESALPVGVAMGISWLVGLLVVGWIVQWGVRRSATGTGRTAAPPVDEAGA